MSPQDTDQFRDLLDRWEELREQGQDPSVEELCRDAPHLVDRLREWTRVLTSGDWLNRRADEVADETIGETGTLTAEEKERHKTLGEYMLLEELGGGGMGRVFKAKPPETQPHRRREAAPAVPRPVPGVGGAVSARGAGTCPALPSEHRRRPRRW